jgi:N-acetyl-alpha-D-glucosaminyl L-malate synthase BshA
VGRLRKALPATVMLVGDGPDRNDAEQEARDLGVADEVHFLGRLDSVGPLLAAADLFVLPSQTESFGLAALEAMACGTPVLAARVGGIPEVVEDGVEGLLEPAGSVEAMARRAVDLLKDPARHAAMRSAALARAARFSTDVVVPQYEAYYQQVLAR